MKIRNGFVSNSSSSSFVVAFDKIPRTMKTMVQLLFGPGAAPDEFVCQYENSASKERVANEVLGDLREKKSKCSRDKLVDLFTGRYPSSCSEEDLYGLFCRPNIKWYGTDGETYAELIGLHVQQNREDKARRTEFEKIIRSKIGNPPLFNSPEHEAWRKKRVDVLKTDDECKRLEEEGRAAWDECWKKDDELRKKLAEVDVDAFLEDNKGAKLRLFEYGDDCGPFYSLMEHGEIFCRLPHIRISHH
jgi:hypothetical protein